MADGTYEAYLRALAAEREAAGAAGDEYAVEMDFALPSSAGAPEPHLLANGHGAYLLFYLADRDPDPDGTWVRIVDPAVDEPEPLGVVAFHGVRAVKLGGPNDEAIAGHPLHGKGLHAYAAHQVVNSRWIAEAERVNSVHPDHRARWHDRLNHYVFCFHDKTFECIAQGFTTERYLASPRMALSELITRL